MMVRTIVEQKQNLFDNGNAFCEYTAMRARVGCDAERTYNALIEACHKKSYPNNYITHGGGGIEDFSGVPGGINEMMLQSYTGVIQLFLSWPRGKEGKFFNLRAYGAFLISSEIKDDEVQFVEIISEKGKEVTVNNPWSIAEVTKGKKMIKMTSERKITFATQAGEVYVMRAKGNNRG